jgi:hypothetical protein
MDILVQKPLEVNESDGFANDILGRKKYGESLLKLVINNQSSFVISLDGRWGEGKTTFVKMWQGLLNQSAVPNIYIDAFANDYVDDAFISIVSAITHYAEHKIPEEHFKALREKAKKVGAKFLSWSVRMGVKAATLGIIKEEDIDLLKGIQKDLSKSLSDSLGDLIDERISSHAEDIQSVESFKEFLSKLPAQLQNNEEGNPLVIIIDELDRCKPTFAIEILEKIKHLFSVPNIIFLLVVNRDQLEESIRSVYGQKVDAHTYLQKFINIETKLPKNTRDNYKNDVNLYAHKLIDLHEIDSFERNNYILESIDLIGNHFSLSLRQMERVFTNLSIFYGSITEIYPMSPDVIVFLAIIKVIEPQIFDRILHQKISYDDFCAALKLPKIDQRTQGNLNDPMFRLMKLLKFGLLDKEEFEKEKDDFVEFYTMFRMRSDASRENMLPRVAQRLSIFEGQ